MLNKLKATQRCRKTLSPQIYLHCLIAFSIIPPVIHRYILKIFKEAGNN